MAAKLRAQRGAYAPAGQVPISPDEPPAGPSAPPEAPPGPDLPDIPIDDPPSPTQPTPDSPDSLPVGDPPSDAPTRMRQRRSSRAGRPSVQRERSRPVALGRGGRGGRRKVA